MPSIVNNNKKSNALSLRIILDRRRKGFFIKITTYNISIDERYKKAGKHSKSEAYRLF